MRLDHRGVTDSAARSASQVCAPYSTLAPYTYKVKLTPGAQKKAPKRKRAGEHRPSQEELGLAKKDDDDFVTAAVKTADKEEQARKDDDARAKQLDAPLRKQMAEEAEEAEEYDVAKQSGRGFPPPSLLTTVPTADTTDRTQREAPNQFDVSNLALILRRLPLKHGSDRGRDDFECGAVGELVLDFVG